ncbi:MAG TPA: hypothetical protein ENK57_09795 [Polyangiaceae bacterium]|nr:hypothetical protein [Polyangiaceae bacterium]
MTIQWTPPGSSNDSGDVVLEYDESATEHSLLFVHTTIDETVAGSVVTRGLIGAMPFLVAPPSTGTGLGWPLTSPEFTALQSTYSFEGQPSVIPPRRIAQHVQAFVAANYGPGFGTFGNNGNVQVDDTTVQPTTTLADWDERQAFANVAWTSYSNSTRQTFVPEDLGRRSVIQAAYEFQNSMPNLPPLDAGSLAKINEMLDQKVGYEIYIQVVHVIPPAPSGKIRIHLGYYMKLRRRSLLQQGLANWLSIKGVDRYAPHAFDRNVSVYLGPLGDEAHILFDHPVGSLAQPTTLVAYFPTTSGFVAVPQTPNPTSPYPPYDLLRPNVGIFQVPMNAITGVAYFEDVFAAPTMPGGVPQPVLPVNPFESGAFFFAYDPQAPL